MQEQTDKRKNRGVTIEQLLKQKQKSKKDIYLVFKQHQIKTQNVRKQEDRTQRSPQRFNIGSSQFVHDAEEWHT